MSIGIKVTVSNIKDYDVLNNYVIENKATYKTFTYNMRHKTPIKIVLLDLPILNTDEIKHEINRLVSTKQLVCENVQLMKSRKQKYDEYALYLLNFNRQHFDFNALKSITGIFNVKVRWSSYKRRSGPTQCSNCQIFGHGNNNCNLPSVCSLCGEGHKQDNCVYLDSYEQGTYTSIKCSNCNGNHPANALQCPKRNEFINMRESLSRKANHRQRRPINNANLAFADKTAYPSLKQPRQVTSYHNWSETQAHNDVPQTTHSSSSQMITQQPSTSQTNNNRHQPPNRPAHRPTHHPAHSLSYTQQQPQNDANDLFSPEELLQITYEIVSSLQKCTNKAEQFNAMAKLAIKYLSANFHV